MILLPHQKKIPQSHHTAVITECYLTLLQSWKARMLRIDLFTAVLSPSTSQPPLPQVPHPQAPGPLPATAGLNMPHTNTGIDYQVMFIA